MNETLARLHRLEKLWRIRAVHEDQARLLLEAASAEVRSLAAQQQELAAAATNARTALHILLAQAASASPGLHRVYAEDESRRSKNSLRQTAEARMRAQQKLPPLQQHFHARRIESEQMQSLCDKTRAALREQRLRAQNAEADELAAQKLLRDRRKTNACAG